MHSDIINDFLSKEVEITIANGNSYIGVIKVFDETKQVVILSTRNGGYKGRNLGNTAVRQKDIVSISELLPYIQEEDEECEDKQMIGLRHIDPYLEQDILKSGDESDEVKERPYFYKKNM